jgi:hypothetical protein
MPRALRDLSMSPAMPELAEAHSRARLRKSLTDLVMIALCFAVMALVLLLVRWAFAGLTWIGATLASHVPSLWPITNALADLIG